MTHYTVEQMMPAAPGMYRIDVDKETCTLVVMWALVLRRYPANKFRPEQQIIGLTCTDLKADLGSILPELFEASSEFSSKAVPGFTSIR